jgi:LacI family transcriptional regulator
MARPLNLLLDFTPVTEYLRQIVLGANQFCREHGSCRIRTSTKEATLIEDGDVIDGVLAVIDRADSKHPATRFNRPVVNISTIASPVPFPTVAMDNRMVGRLAAEHLLVQGYRSFAYHMESSVFFSRERHAGFAVFFEESGKTCTVFDTALHRGATSGELNALTYAWLMELPKPLGLGTHNDQRANALADLCNDRGIKVPSEVGIIGVDNDPLVTQLCHPSLTSVDPGAAAIGLRAAETLVRIIDGAEPAKKPLALPPKGVVVRESTEPGNLIDPRLSAALHFIRRHVSEEVGVDQLLEAVPASRRSLERLFKVHLGRSPAEEIRRARINHVKWLLIDSSLSLGLIADKCGFSSFRGFASAFHREVGISASAYRKRLGFPEAGQSTNLKDSRGRTGRADRG